MLHSILALAFAAAVIAEDTIHGVVMFHRHGDRTAKVTGSTKLTVTGQNQLFNSGQYWRSRYLDSSSSTYINDINTTEVQATQITASSPDDPVLVMSGQAFLQGLYPPTSDKSGDDVLANGSTLEAPLSGYQYVHLSTIQDDSPETIAIKGDVDCPAYTAATKQVPKTDATYQALVSSTQDFYNKFYDDILSGVMNKSDVSYANAYTIFDYINVQSIHNDTVRKLVAPDSSDMFQLRTLADSHEWALNGNITNENLGLNVPDYNDPRSVGGRTLAHAILESMHTTISSNGTSGKFSVMFGSYDTYLQFFGLTSMSSASTNFTGLPDYASAMAFELFSNNSAGTGSGKSFPNQDDLMVRMVFRNGTTQGDAQQYSMFGRPVGQLVMSWVAFNDYMGGISIGSTAQWCTFCGVTDQDFCNATSSDVATAPAATTIVAKSSPLSSPAAGVVGAVCALAVVALVGLGMAFAGFRVRRRRSSGSSSSDSSDNVMGVSNVVMSPHAEKGSFGSA